ncbi:MAG: hypothetical protein RJQ01_08045 [Microcella sp.]|uniref:hypothetical protein n=1 Tax=Microcella sp. TaxID=1913979 RepID=UPI003314626F
MSIADDVAAGPPAAERRPGKIAAWIESLADKDRAAVDALLANQEWRHVDVRDLFAKHGLEASPQSIGEYRKARYGYR